jgi:hypothetical protein
VSTFILVGLAVFTAEEEVVVFGFRLYRLAAMAVKL